MESLRKTLFAEVNSRAFEVAKLKALESEYNKANARTVRAMQRAQVAERQVINAARALALLTMGVDEPLITVLY